MNAAARKGLAIHVSDKKIAFVKFTIVLEAAYDNRKRIKIFTRIVNLYLIKKTTCLNASIELLQSLDCGRRFSVILYDGFLSLLSLTGRVNERRGMHVP